MISFNLKLFIIAWAAATSLFRIFSDGYELLQFVLHFWYVLVFTWIVFIIADMISDKLKNQVTILNQ
jgi:hypothetical protein